MTRSANRVLASLGWWVNGKNVDFDKPVSDLIQQHSRLQQQEFMLEALAKKEKRLYKKLDRAFDADFAELKEERTQIARDEKAEQKVADGTDFENMMNDFFDEGDSVSSEEIAESNKENKEKRPNFLSREPKKSASLASVKSSMKLRASAGAATPSKATTESPYTSWNYLYHGQDWELGECNKRERQSPIDFDHSCPWKWTPALMLPGELPDEYWARNRFYYQYELLDGNSDVMYGNNGHSLAANFAGNGIGGLTFKKGWYNLMSLVLHMKGEHTYLGERPPMELHLIHKRYDSDAIVAVAMPIIYKKDAEDPAAAENPELIKLLNLLRADTEKPQPALAKKLGRPTVFRTRLRADREPLRLNNLLQNEQMYFRYHGGLTVPPCSEIVDWFVLREPLVLNDPTEVEFVEKSIQEATAGNGNYRSTMPRQARPVTLVQSLMGEPPASEEISTGVVSRKTTKVFQGVTEGHAAMDMAADAVNSANALGWAVLKNSASTAEAMEKTQGLDHYVPTSGDGRIKFRDPAASKSGAPMFDEGPPKTPQQKVFEAENKLKAVTYQEADAAKAKAAKAIKEAAGYGGILT